MAPNDSYNMHCGYFYPFLRVAGKEYMFRHVDFARGKCPCLAGNMGAARNGCVLVYMALSDTKINQTRCIDSGPGKKQ